MTLVFYCERTDFKKTIKYPNIGYQSAKKCDLISSA